MGARVDTGPSVEPYLRLIWIRASPSTTTLSTTTSTTLLRFLGSSAAHRSSQEATVRATSVSSTQTSAVEMASSLIVDERARLLSIYGPSPRRME